MRPKTTPPLEQILGGHTGELNHKEGPGTIRRSPCCFPIEIEANLVAVAKMKR